MGFKYLDVLLPTDYQEEELKQVIINNLKINNFDYWIERKSLDARDKKFIHWEIKIVVVSEEIKSNEIPLYPKLEIPYRKRKEKVVVIGSGPAGFFSAYVLQLAGFETIIIEQGTELSNRIRDVKEFERTGNLNESSNYAFGEGGAGTFSDGKLTARSKRIKVEKHFIFDTYIEAGAPKEIAYLAHPHIGTDNLKKIVVNLRKKFLELGGTFLFNTRFQGLIKDEKNKTMVKAIETNAGDIISDFFIFATGHSSYQAYRKLINQGVQFRQKPFAIGTRVEHKQEIINKSQWGVKSLHGVKSAEYKLTDRSHDCLSVYSFCMCPGGMVVPTAPYKELCVVNGMSKYKRDGNFANSGIVASINLNELLHKEVSATEALDWLEGLERGFYNVSKSSSAPACNIKDFLSCKTSKGFGKTSYPFPLISADFRELLPEKVIFSIEQGLKNFKIKIKDFDEGVMIGLESKTSSPIQVIRDEKGLANGFENIYFAGEGSGYAGGIISSAADGIKIAITLLS